MGVAWSMIRGMAPGGEPHLWCAVDMAIHWSGYAYALSGIPDGKYPFFGDLPRPQGRDVRVHPRGRCLLGLFSCLPLSVRTVPAGADSPTAPLREGSPRSWVPTSTGETSMKMTADHELLNESDCPGRLPATWPSSSDMTPLDRQDCRRWPWTPVASPAIHSKHRP